jgi:hypothetical protein
MFNVGKRFADDLSSQARQLEAVVLPKTILSHCSESKRTVRKPGQLPAPVVAAPCLG